MFEILVTLVFLWLFYLALKLAFSVAWGLAKGIAVLLCLLALPALVVGLLSAAGFILLIPLGVVLAAWGLLKACTRA